MKNIKRYISFFWMICFLFITKASAFSFENDKLKIESFMTTSEDDALDVIFKISLKNGWHISWQNPGDAGVPTKFEFQNATASFVHSSVPEKFLYEEILTQYGYSNKAYYLFHLSELKENPSVLISWTACRDYCEPEEVLFEINEKDSPLFNTVQVEAEKTFPKRLSTPVYTSRKNSSLVLKVRLNEDILSFIPDQPNIISPDAPQTVLKNGVNNKIIIKDFDSEMLPAGGIIQTSNNAYRVFVLPQKPHLFMLLLLAFMGGIILNLMPCVFPVLSLKALFLASETTTSKKRFQRAFLYMLGVLLSFFAICAVLYLFKAGGAYLGWGFQLQSPVFVGIILVFFTLILLYLWNILRIEMPFVNKFAKASSLNSFMAGLFAVVVATPCTGPFMGMAIGYALFETPSVYFPVFMSLGFGYALPFTMLEMFPSVVKKILPSPGIWMQRLKYILSIPILLTVLWLGWVLFHELSYIKEKNDWEPFSLQELEKSLSEGDSVLIDFTAKWCLTCLLNEQTTLNSEDFIKTAQKQGVKLLKADWTSKNPEIFETLKFYGRSSVPLYIFYKKGSSKAQYIVLPQILTPDIVQKTLFKED